MLNRIVLIGRLVRDPELRYTGQGTPVCEFTLAVDRGYSDDTDFIKVVTWRKSAESCAHHLGKGRLVGVDGEMHIDKRKSEKNDRTYINPKVNADNVKFLDWPDDDNGGNDDFEEPEDDVDDEDSFDVPF